MAIQDLIAAQNKYRASMADNLEELMKALNENGIIDMNADIKAFQSDLRKEVSYNYEGVVSR